MGDSVKVRQEVETVETPAGTEVWVPDGPTVAGMVAGGYWSVIDRRPDTRKGRKVEPFGEVADDGGQDQA